MKKIALVIGHRSGSKGAYGDAGISEWDFWNEFISDIYVDLPTNHQFKLFLRSNAVDGYGERMKEMHKRIDEWGADISVSFHFNASSIESVTGHEVLYCSNGGKRLAVLMDKHLDMWLNNKDRNIKKRLKHDRGGGFLCRGNSKCILVEPFFASHQSKFIRGGEHRSDLINAFLGFFEAIV